MCNTLFITCAAFFFLQTGPEAPEQSPAKGQPSLSVYLSLWHSSDL